LKLDKKSQEYVHLFNDCSLPDDDSKEFAILKDNGFVVYERIDEFGRICLQEKQAMFVTKPEQLSFVIAPGMNCNYSCKYCFEADSDKTGVMTLEVAEKVSKYICNQLKRNSDAKKLHISWFGGEPLLYIDAIEIISRSLVEFTNKISVEYNASIVTNGRFLDKITLNKLLSFGIKKAQVTLDGTESVYCESKGASREDFNYVIRNIIYASGKVNLSVRLNIPKNDAKEAIEITDLLLSNYDLLGKIDVYFAFINDYSPSIDDDAERKSFINYVENHLFWFYYLVNKYGVSENQRIGTDRKSTHCAFVCMDTICIGPYGELYKCEHDFGNVSRIMGDVWHDRYYSNSEYKFYSGLDSPEKIKCFKCKYAPICVGGCMSHNINGYNGFDCEAYGKLQLRLKLFQGGVKTWSYL
jgi:uncharacterized protein